MPRPAGIATTATTDAPPMAADGPPPVEPPRPPTTSDLAVALAYWICRLMAHRYVSEEAAYQAAIATIRQIFVREALRSARRVLGPLSVPVQRVIRWHSERRAAIRGTRRNKTPDEYSPSIRPARFQRLRAIRVLTAGGERHEIRSVRARCPVCRTITPQVLELNLPFYVAISCLRCRPTSNRSRQPSYSPAPFYLRPMAGPDGVIASDVDGAVAVLSRIVGGIPV
jgi:hypothetical protein